MTDITADVQPRRSSVRESGREAMRDPAYQSYVLLRAAFTVAPILFGLDKFFNILVVGRNTSRRGSTDSSPGAPQT